MVKLIMGGAGTGKTKEIIDRVNAAVQEEKGSVVCIAKGDKLKFDVAHDARLINVSDYSVDSYPALLGFVAGMHAGNYDISKVFIDALYKIVDSKDASEAEKFLLDLDAFASKHSVDFVVALSEEEIQATETMKKYL
ncbi:MAG: hypothetical protein ACLUDG_03590 [Butyricicoccus sp.]|nr:hypothetical protein [Butyricicoccus pullicaecorum]MBS5150335.1 hypothetical protein [Butyricicoccus pullicaecorum]MBS5165694.1 hypothetical protein [Butyricicoccus pullicaecorum]MDO4669262.1 hypothetical protein [Butyricicoccus pullicaecorum]